MWSCKYHILLFEIYDQDIWKLKIKFIFSGTKVVTLEMANKLKKKNVHILPGYKLCRECIKVFEEIDSTDDDADNDDDDDDDDDDNNDDDDDLHDDDDDEDDEDEDED